MNATVKLFISALTIMHTLSQTPGIGSNNTPLADFSISQASLIAYASGLKLVTATDNLVLTKATDRSIL